MQELQEKAQKDHKMQLERLKQRYYFENQHEIVHEQDEEFNQSENTNNLLKSLSLSKQIQGIGTEKNKDRDIHSQQVQTMLKEEKFEEQLQEQKYQQLQKRIQEAMYNESFDKELEMAIAKKISEGKTNQQIMQELLGGQSASQQKKKKIEDAQVREIQETFQTQGQQIGFDLFQNSKIDKNMQAYEEFKKIKEEQKQQQKNLLNF
ncbi:hypothetical protein PPERSA_09641 [Pseudocohnilembus persalinus]|uniref:Uncharacterized protein n=1 Tax=Pseudocohnilembus persalinus TaxID=266149 RepID=A0A0V0QFQ6_PSEPJ|nr:hypothetical protein PPERSA_09641 [Pseudocohnilembus persalinus]|eukprot:KRX01035.1 hypothetical protein PPERSA_09641 [Pseudocohnilembus persalinus]